MTRTGRVEDEPGSRKLYQLILDDYQAKNTKALRRLVAMLRSLRFPRTFGAGGQDSERVRWEGIRTSEIQFESEPGIVITGKLYPGLSREKARDTLVAGKLSDWLAERTAKSGRVVLKLEPRLSFLAGKARRPYVGDYLADERATLIGRNFTGDAGARHTAWGRRSGCS